MTAEIDHILILTEFRKAKKFWLSKSVTITWKFYLLFGHHIVDDIWKSRYIQQIP